MASNPLQSPLRRFVQKSGVSFFWAFVFGLVIGGAAWFRVERAELEDQRWHVPLRLWLERLEWWTYDWRAREAGDVAARSDEVVLATVDDETVANASEAERSEWAMRPWPRALTGGLLAQAVREGAALVLLDESVADVSPHHCSGCKGEGRRSDDQQLGDALDKNPGKVVLAWDWARDGHREGDRPLAPFVVRVGSFADEPGLLGAVREVLEQRLPAYVLSETGQATVWAGVPTEARGKEVAAALDVKGAPSVRTRTPEDEAGVVTREWLALRLGRVEVAGLDPARLLQVRSVDAPVAPLLSAASPSGAATLLPDADGRVRGVPLLVAMRESGGKTVVLPSAPLRAVMQHVGAATLRYQAGQLAIGDRLKVPMDPQGMLWLHWDTADSARTGRGPVKRAVPAWRLLVNREDDEAGRGIRHFDDELKGRVVIFTDERSSDPGRAALTSVGEMSRAGVMAQAIVDMLGSRGIRRVEPEVDLWLTVAFAVAGAVLAMAWSSLVRRPGWLAWVATLGGVGALHAFVARQLFLEQGRWVGMAGPLLACGLTFLASLGYARAFEQGFREFILRALGGAVRADIFRRVESDLLLMRPERRELTVYFSDIEGFTRAADVHEPREVVHALQDYLAAATQLVIDRSGHVDKYLGDGLMAFWGAPVDLEEQAAVACETAVVLREHYDRHRERYEKQLGRPLVMRAGLDLGPTIVGEMGTLHRVNYTVMGEHVARAFQLESLAKRYGARILVGPAVPERAGPGFVFREVDAVRLARGGEAVRVYELLGRAKDLPGRTAALEAHAAGLKAFRERRFADALEVFKQLAATEKDDPLPALYVARCERYLAAPPPEQWDGVVAE